MNGNGKKLLVSAFAALTTACFAQPPPPNDNFTNRIPLVGSSVCWTGNTANATWDAWDKCVEGHWFFEPGQIHSWSDHSVWWSWVAVSNSPVMIEKLGGFDSLNGFLAVYAFDPSEFWQVVITAIDLHWRGQYVTFDAQAGREYQIKIAVQETNDMVFRLTASDAPVFRLQPGTQTVSSNGSALFTAWAFGVKPLHYQWRYNGLDVPNATNAMLPIYSAKPTNAGEYCVVVSSAAGGVSTSEVARLIISANDPTPSVRAVQSVGGTNFVFSVNGEEGRSYLVESSTNLVDWPTPQKRFVVLNTNQTTTFQIPKDTPEKFFRCSPYHPQNEICDCNLKQLRFAVWQLAEDYRMDEAAAVTMNDTLPYLINHEWPRCPDDDYPLGFSYWVGWVNNPVGCIVGHVLEAPQPN